jgi:hypothetical protein
MVHVQFCHFRPPGFPRCVFGHFLCPAFPAVPRCLTCCVLPTRPVMMRLPFLVCLSLPPLGLLSMLQLPRLPTVMTKFSFRISHTVLLWFCVMVMLRFLSRALVFLAFPPPTPLLSFTLNVPHRLAAAVDSFSGMVITDLLLHLLPSQSLGLLPQSHLPCCSPMGPCVIPSGSASSCAPSTHLYHTALVSCYGDAEIPLPSLGVSCLSSSTSPPIVCPQPALQAGGRGSG